MTSTTRLAWALCVLVAPVLFPSVTTAQQRASTADRVAWEASLGTFGLAAGFGAGLGLGLAADGVGDWVWIGPGAGAGAERGVAGGR